MMYRLIPIPLAMLLTAAVSPAVQADPVLPNHELVRQTYLTSPGFERLVYEVKVRHDEPLSASQLRNAARQVWQEAGHKHTTVYVRFYLEGMDLDGDAYAVAVLRPVDGTVTRLRFQPDEPPWS